MTRPIKIETDAKDRTVYDVLVLDASGSMHMYKRNTIKNINDYVTALKDTAKKTGVKTNAALYTFNNEVTKLINLGPVEEIPEITAEMYICTGMTALADAFKAGIDALREELKGREGDDDIDVTLTIFTDGQENASQHTTMAEVKALADELTSAYQWNFAMLGAGPDELVQAAAQTIGIHNSVGYAASCSGFESAGQTMTRSRSARTMSFAAGENLSASYFVPPPPDNQ